MKQTAMNDNDILILTGQEVQALLRDRDHDLVRIVRAAYEAHALGQSSLPHSLFLRFPGQSKDRIIALPAYLGQDFEVAGVKWIASFPGNLERGIDRASAVIVLNSASTGRPQAIIEGSIISSKRTAASAALAAYHLQPPKKASCAGMIGCGLINFETARFLLATCPDIRAFVVYDLDIERARVFKEKLQTLSDTLEIVVAEDMASVLRQSTLISIATTAVEPYIRDLSSCAPGTTILHISLRDLAPEVVLGCDNVVDDVDHVCRAQTSLHLVEQMVGNRSFIRCTLADVLLGAQPGRKDTDSNLVFSPFGLGILDLAFAKFVYDLASSEGQGTVIRSFLPEFWTQRDPEITRS